MTICGQIYEYYFGGNLKNPDLIPLLCHNKMCLWHCLPSRVTRFGKISPFWQKFTSLWQIFDGVFLIWSNSKPSLTNLLHYWANFHCYKWPNIETEFNNLVTLSPSYLFYLNQKNNQSTVFIPHVLLGSNFIICCQKYD